MKHAENSGLASADPIVAITTTSPPEAPSFWPPYTSLPRGFPSHSLLVGTEALVWQSLGAVLGSDKTSHVTPTLALTKLESSAKQVALRQALRRIGLGWVATNTTPFRIVAGKLYNRAVDQLKQLCSDSAVEDLSKESDHHRASPLPKRRKLSSTSCLPSVTVRTFNPPSSTIFHNQPLVNDQFERILPSVTKSQRTALWQQLETQGAVVLRQAVPQTALEQFEVSTTHCSAKQSKPQAGRLLMLRETMGNGVAGTPPSRYYTDLPEPARTQAAKLSAILWDLLLDQSTSAPPCKSIYLEYSVEAEKWAHQDHAGRSDRPRPPVQAVLLLLGSHRRSSPACGKLDFVGGQFYVARRCVNNDRDTNTHNDTTTGREITLDRYMVGWEQAGDLVLFLSANEWWHGMMPVEAQYDDDDDDDVNEVQSTGEPTFVRRAIGLLQPP